MPQAMMGTHIGRCPDQTWGLLRTLLRSRAVAQAELDEDVAECFF